MDRVRKNASAHVRTPVEGRGGAVAQLTTGSSALFPRLASRPPGRQPSISSPLHSSTLTHSTSPYRPLVRAHDRMTYWSSPSAIRHRAAFRRSAHLTDLARLDFLQENPLRQSTLTTYGAGLAHWIAWCNLRDIPEAERFPISSSNLALFLAHLSRSRSASVIRHTLSGLRHWHDINDLVWNGSSPFMAKIRGAAQLHAPDRSRPPRPPVTLQHLEALRSGLSFSNTRDSAVYAVATIAFWGVCRLGELTVPSLSTFSSRYNVPRDTFLMRKVLPNGSRSVLFRIPWSKTTKRWGADIVLTAQAHGTCPIMALDHHLLINAGVPPEHGLFSYLEGGAPKYLTKAAFLARCAEVWKEYNLPMVQGHSFRIGGATEHLRRGLSLDLLQIQGRWTSDSFKLYLRHLDEILSAAINSAVVH